MRSWFFLAITGTVFFLDQAFAESSRETIRCRNGCCSDLRWNRSFAFWIEWGSTLSSSDDHVLLLRRRHLLRLDQILHSHHQIAFVKWEELQRRNKQFYSDQINHSTLITITVVVISLRFFVSSQVDIFCRKLFERGNWNCLCKSVFRCFTQFVIRTQMRKRSSTNVFRTRFLLPR